MSKLLHAKCLLFNVLFFICLCSLTPRPLPIIPQNLLPSHPIPPSMLPPPKCSSTVDQSPEPKGSESQPTPVTNKETLGSLLTVERLGGSVQVLLTPWCCFLSERDCFSLSFAHSFICDAQLGSFRLWTHYRWRQCRSLEIPCVLNRSHKAF